MRDFGRLLSPGSEAISYSRMPCFIHQLLRFEITRLQGATLYRNTLLLQGATLYRNTLVLQGRLFIATDCEEEIQIKELWIEGQEVSIQPVTATKRHLKRVIIVTGSAFCLHGHPG